MAKKSRLEGEPQCDAHAVQLTKREMDVTRKWLAYGCGDPDSLDADIETAESVIAKLEALGAKGTL